MVFRRNVKFSSPFIVYADPYYPLTDEDCRVKAECENRMKVFDKAPKHVRDKANRIGEEPLQRWWLSQTQWNMDHRGNIVPARNIDTFERLW